MTLKFVKRILNLVISVMVLNNKLLFMRAQSPGGTSVILGNKHYYIETTQQGNFYEAAYSCAQYDMTLASIENKAEYDRLYAILKTTDNLNKEYWLSANNNGNSAKIYSWFGTGKQVSYWPGTALDTESTCIKTVATTFAYAALSCTDSNPYYICEKPLEPNCGKLGQCRYTYSSIL